MKFLETSTPGLPGQSGGPVFDRRGTVWGIQSHTWHLPLGFRPVVEHDGEQTVENQFLNVGMAIHPQVIVDFLEERGIAFEMSGE